MAAPVAPVHNHTSDNVPPSLIGQPAGQDQDSQTFQKQYDIITEWDINCAACCWHYLTTDRHYGTSNGCDNRVTYGQAENHTKCYISPKQGNSKYGQFKTARDSESYGKPVPGSLIRNNRTFRLYSNSYTPEPTVIGTAINVLIRVESISIPCITKTNISGSYQSYNNAAILELYYAKDRMMPLQGVCETIKVNLSALAITTDGSQVKQEIKDPK